MLSEIQPAPTAEEQAVLTPDAPSQPPEVETPAPEKPEREEKTVPLAALHEERQTRKQLQAEMRALREQQERQAQEYQIAQQRLVTYLQSREPKAATPDKEQDPLGYTAHAIERTQEQVQALAQQQFQREQAERQAREEQMRREQQNQQLHQLRTLTEQGERAFSAEKPDYKDAVKFIREQQTRRHMALGATPEQAAAEVEREAMFLAHTALVQGVNPAERAYALAQAMGYQPQAVDPEQKMKMQEAGQQASKASGGAVKGRLSAAQIASMTATQLAAMSDEEFRAVMGG